MKRTDFAGALYRYFRDYLVNDRGCSARTIETYRYAFIQFIDYMENQLYDGEYFIQNIRWKELQASDPTKVQSVNSNYSKEGLDLLEKEGPKYQYGKGCLSDGVVGAWLSLVCGLDEAIDRKKILSHLLSVHKYLSLIHI